MSKRVREDERARFEAIILPHLRSAYNLARWLTRNEHDAEDVAQEAFLRAFRSFDTFVSGRDPRNWLLAIVRNTCFSWMRQNRPHEMMSPLDDGCEYTVESGLDPETALMKKASSGIVRQAIEELPLEYREVLVLRELEDLSYKEIAQLIDIPLGTVMSRLSRARKGLSTRLGQSIGEAKL